MNQPCDVHSSRESLEEQILATQANITNLHQKVYNLREALNTKSPILSILPVDVLAEIFICALFTERSDRTTYLGPPMPITIDAVCKSWRNIAWTTSRLWSNLEVNFQADKATVQHQLISEWIGRSGNHPLTLQLRFYPDPEDETNWQPPLDVARLLLAASARWESITIVGGPFRTFVREMNRNQYQFPSLSSLYIADAHHYTYPWKFPSSILLHKVSLVGHALRASRYEIIWSSVHHLDVAFDMINAVFLLQAASSSLTQLDIAIIKPSGAAPLAAGPVPINFPNLTQLSLSSNSSTQSVDPARLLYFIEAPALDNLAITLSPREGGRRQEIGFALLDMIPRTGCLLTDLSLYGITLSELETIRVLHCIPSVQRLSLSYPFFAAYIRMSDNIINVLNPAIIIQAQPAPCLPNLTDFRLTGHIGFTTKAMIDMLDSRLLALRQPTDETQNTSRILKLESLRIAYYNSDWMRMNDPNSIFTFHRRLAEFSMRDGLDVDMTCIT